MKVLGVIGIDHENLTANPLCLRHFVPRGDGRALR
jgi:hypothetical protein